MISLDKNTKSNKRDDSDTDLLLKKKNNKKQKNKKTLSEIKEEAEKEEEHKCQFSCMPIKYVCIQYSLIILTIYNRELNQYITSLQKEQAVALGYVAIQLKNAQ